MEVKTKYVKLYDDPDIDKHIEPMSERYNNGHMEEGIGVSLNMPFECENSASRKTMFASQYQQRVCLMEPEVPYLSTGYENLFGQKSSSFVKSDRQWQVIGKIEKFSNKPGHHYFLIVIDQNNNMDVIERVSYTWNTESYGYLNNNKYLDRLDIGSVIPQGVTVKKSQSFDVMDNYMGGKNLNVTYISDSHTTEDAIEISESTSYAMGRPSIKKVIILINDNDIPSNLYGTDNDYRVIPDIGEEIKKGIICGTRTTRNDEIFFTQSAERLTKPMINDITFKTKGTVIDINIYTNKDIATSPNSMYEGQLAFYDRDYKRFCQEIVDLLRDYIDNSMYTKSAELSELYTTCEMVCKGAQYFKDNQFSNIMLELIVFERAPLDEGDKVTSRYGGKGVISRVIPDNMMPRISGTDEIVDLIWNQATCVNRLNPGQLFELSINFISARICEYIIEFGADVELCVDMIDKFYRLLSTEWADFVQEQLENCINDDEVIFTISDWITTNFDGLYVVLKPITEVVTLDDLMKLYQEFPWIKPVFLDVPIKNSRGDVRYVQSVKPSIVAKQYIYRMKQNAEEKHSATSMSATNVRNLNSKSKASKMFMRVHSNTPIRFGEMENSILMLMGAEIQINNLMMYSTSPQARRDAGQMLESYDFNVQLSKDGKSRSAEMLNAILKCMGNKLLFTKKLINYTEPGHNYSDDNHLYHFMDDYKNKLIKPFGENEKKLLHFMDDSKNKLYHPIDESPLFEWKGDKP